MLFESIGSQGQLKRDQLQSIISKSSNIIDTCSSSIIDIITSIYLYLSILFVDIITFDNNNTFLQEGGIKIKLAAAGNLTRFKTDLITNISRSKQLL